MTVMFSTEVTSLTWYDDNVTSYEPTPQGDPFVKQPIFVLLYRIVGAIGKPLK